MMDLRYRNQVALLLRVLPEIAREKDFALHGGTAINLFYHNMPRLSVDIDLTYVPFKNRRADLAIIRKKLLSISGRLKKIIPGIDVKAPIESGDELKLYCSVPGALVKVEVNTINRGIAGAPENKSLCIAARELFDSYCEIQVVPVSQLFGGKIIAALDRQHPRDLFDLKKLFESTGYTGNIHKGFLFCLLSSKRPIHEILDPFPLNQSMILKSHFKGMTDEEFTYEMFESTRSQLIEKIHTKLTSDEKEFIMSFADGSPIWLDNDYSAFPGVRWKLLNINKLKKANSKKFIKQMDQLRNVLYK